MALAAFGFVVQTMTAEMNRQGAAEELRMVRGALTRDVESVALSVGLFGASDEAVAHLYGTPDTGWLGGLLGTSGASGYVIDGAGRTLAAAGPESATDRDLARAIGGVLPALMRTLPRTATEHGFRHPKPVFGYFHGKPVFLAGTAIRYKDERRATPGPPRYLIAVEPATRLDIQSLAANFALHRPIMRFARTPTPGKAYYELGEAGQPPIAIIEWDQHAPGSEVLRSLRAPLLLVAVAFVALAGFLAQRLVRSNATLADRSRVANESVSETLNALRAAESARRETEAALANVERTTRVLQATQRERLESERRFLDERAAGARDIAQSLSESIGAITALLTQDARELDERVATTRDAVALQAEQAETARERSATTAANSAGITDSLDRLLGAVRTIQADARQHRSAIQTGTAEARSARAGQAELREEIVAVNDAAIMIREIATRTNLLALNATIEASRAGAGGAGFAVVATEVKALATRASAMTSTITAAVQRIDATSRSTSELVDKLHDLLSSLAVSSANSMTVVEQHEREAVRIQAITAAVHMDAGATDLAVANITAAAGALTKAARDTQSIGDQVRRRAAQLNAELDTFVRQLRG